MERELAVRMLAAIESLTPGLDEATRITQAMADQVEVEQLRGHLGRIIADELFAPVMHIIKEYPELDPDKLAR